MSAGADMSSGRFGIAGATHDANLDVNDPSGCPSA